MTLLRKNQSNGRGPRVEFYKIDRTNSNYTLIDRAHQTEQLLSRHLMVTYYGMQMVPQKSRIEINSQKNDARIFS